MSDSRINGEMLKGHTATLVLAILGERPAHGYELMKTLTERSHNALELGQGTIYPLLYSLEEQGLIKSEDKQIDGRKRRVYSLTATGRKALAERRKGWQLFQSTMNAILNPLTTVDL